MKFYTSIKESVDLWKKFVPEHIEDIIKERIGNALAMQFKGIIQCGDWVVDNIDKDFNVEMLDENGNSSEYQLKDVDFMVQLEIMGQLELKRYNLI